MYIYTRQKKFVMLNIKNLKLDHLNLPSEAAVVVFLISEDLKMQRIFSALSQMGCEDCASRTRLSKLILSMAGFDELSERVYELYYKLLDDHDQQISLNFDNTIDEAFRMYQDLVNARAKFE